MPDAKSHFFEPPVALRAMNRTFGRVGIKNHRPGLPAIQCLNGKMLETAAKSLLPLAKRIIDTNGVPRPGELGAQELVATRLSFCGSG